MFLEHCRHIECVCVSFCLSRRERAGTDSPLGDGTHGPVIISTGRSQEMHFTRSNSFLEDIHSSTVAPSQTWGCPFPRQCLGRLQVCMPQGWDFSSHPTSVGSGPAQLGCADPHLWPPGAEVGNKRMCSASFCPKHNEVFKTRGLLESSPSQ